LTDTAEQSFGDFPIHPDIVAALADHGITHPFPIQAMTLPVALGRHDIIGQAKTGTGKTLGFGIPHPHRVVSPRDEWADFTPAPASRRRSPSPRPVSSPCRWPATSSGPANARHPRAHRLRRARLRAAGRRLQRGVEVVVGTPGRLIDLAKQGHLDLSRARTVVLDEADEMLDLGFLPDVEKLSRSPRRTARRCSSRRPCPVPSWPWPAAT
jgi:superfamily II DNA/RNA helicase